jgi:hypothetical protein
VIATGPFGDVKNYNGRDLYLSWYLTGLAAESTVIEDVRLEGGWVYAAGQGSLADPRSTLHRRDRIGITRAGSYISVDTGTYSIAPWLAREVAAMIA